MIEEKDREEILNVVDKIKNITTKVMNSCSLSNEYKMAVISTLIQEFFFSYCTIVSQNSPENDLKDIVYNTLCLLESNTFTMFDKVKEKMN